jgi:histidinol-phosphatase (PHP family)
MLKTRNCRMALPADYHMHTPLCLHATGEPEEYVQQAIKLGLPEMGLSDHSPMRQDNFDEWRMNLDKLSVYVANVRRAQKAFPQMPIRLAMEVDYFPGGEDWVRELAGMYPWDYFIGSVHYVSDDWAIDDPKKISEWKNHDSREVWRIYFERLAMAAESKLFEIIGHADLPKKFGHKPAAGTAEFYGKFLDAAKKSGCAIELNTAGLRKDCKEIYPSREIVQMAFQKDVPIVFGSDAHAPGEAGMNFADAVQLAHSAGYTKTCRFANRQRQIVSF